MNKITLSGLFSVLFGFFVLLYGDKGLLDIFHISSELKTGIMVTLAILSFSFILILLVTYAQDEGIGEADGVWFPLVVGVLATGFMSDFSTAFIGAGHLAGDGTWGAQTIVFALLFTTLLFTFMIGPALLWARDQIEGIRFFIAAIAFVAASGFDIFTSFYGLALIFRLDEYYSVTKSAMLVFGAIMVYTCQFMLLNLFLWRQKKIADARLANQSVIRRIAAFLEDVFS